MITKSTLLSIVIIAILSILVLVAFFPTHPPLPLIASSVSVPDAYMEEVQALFMDKEGFLNMKIVTPKLVHFNADDVTDLVTPQITLYRQSPSPWYISSNYAKATQGIENVLFKENVVIRHAMDAAAPETVIKTSSLQVHPNKKTAETDQSITMLQPNLTVKSKGLFADMSSGDIRLLSQPRGVYVPSS